MPSRLCFLWLSLVLAFSLTGCFDTPVDEPVDAGVIGFTASVVSVNEAEPRIAIKILRTYSAPNVGTLSPAKVSFSTVDGTAKTGEDYEAVNGVLSWGENDRTEKVILVKLIEDTVVEGDQTFSMQLSEPTDGAVLGTSEITVTIVDEDVVVQFAQSSATVSEKDGTVDFEVSRVGSGSGSVSVHFATVDGSAVVGSDYEGSSGTLIWEDGETANKIVSLTLIDDTHGEYDETLSLQLSSPAVAMLGVAQLTITVTSDEPPNRGTLQFNSATFQVAEDVAIAEIPVYRVDGSTEPASVDYAITAINATKGTDYVETSGTLNWADGELGAKFVPIDIIDDVAVEPNEAFTVTLSNVTGAALGANTADVSIDSDDNYEFYIKGGQLVAADPSMPTSPTTIAIGATVVDARKIPAGDYDGPNFRVNNLRSDTIVVAASDGKFYKVDATDASTLAATQVSSETTANMVCPLTSTPYTDYANPLQTAVFFRFPGPDTDCWNGNETYEMITLGMDAATAPVPVTEEPVAVLRDAVSGQITGYLTTSGTDIIRVDAGFQNPSLSLATFSTTVKALPDIGSGLRYLVIDNVIAVYDAGTGLINPLYTLTTGFNENQFAIDSTHLYFSDGAAIKRIITDGVSSAVTTLISNVGGNISAFFLTDLRVVYSTMSGAWEDGLYSIVKIANGGTATPLVKVNAAAGEGLMVRRPLTNPIRYTTFTTGATGYYTLKAAMIEAYGGGLVEIANATWAGDIVDDTLDIAKPHHGDPGPVATILSEGCTRVSHPSLGCAGGVLKVYPYGGKTAGTTIGTMPASTELGFFVEGRLATALDNTNNTIYIVDTRSGSLTLLDSAAPPSLIEKVW